MLKIWDFWVPIFPSSSSFLIAVHHMSSSLQILRLCPITCIPLATHLLKGLISCDRSFMVVEHLVLKVSLFLLVDANAENKQWSLIMTNLHNSWRWAEIWIGLCLFPFYYLTVLYSKSHFLFLWDKKSKY